MSATRQMHSSNTCPEKAGAVGTLQRMLYKRQEVETGLGLTLNLHPCSSHLKYHPKQDGILFRVFERVLHFGEEKSSKRIKVGGRGEIICDTFALLMKCVKYTPLFLCYRIRR